MAKNKGSNNNDETVTVSYCTAMANVTGHQGVDCSEVGDTHTQLCWRVCAASKRRSVFSTQTPPTGGMQ